MDQFESAFRNIYRSLKVVARFLKSFYYSTLSLIHKKSLIAQFVLRKSRSVENFWDLAHQVGNTRWLTGSTPAAELGFLRYSPRALSQEKVLIVGVGKGLTSNYLSDLGLNVEVLDISKIAFDSLTTNIRKRHLASNYETLPTSYYDVILHHLVAQHMSFSALWKQLSALINSLNIGGSLRIQIASSLSGIEDDLSDEPDDQKIGRVLRSPDKLKRDIEADFPVNVTIENQLDFPEWDTGWRWNLLVAKRYA